MYDTHCRNSALIQGNVNAIPGESKNGATGDVQFFAAPEMNATEPRTGAIDLQITKNRGITITA
jgi:hypothetical protein